MFVGEFICENDLYYFYLNPISITMYDILNVFKYFLPTILARCKSPKSIEMDVVIFIYY